MSGYPTIRAERFLGVSYDYALGTTAKQISGGTTALTAFGGLIPSQTRQALVISNPPTSVGILYLSQSSSVTNTGVKALWSLAPGQAETIACNGTTVLYAVGNNAGTLLSLAELQ